MNNEFKWSTENVIEFFEYFDKYRDSRFHLFQYIDDFKTTKQMSKQPVKDYLVLSLIAEYGGHNDVEYNYNSATGFYVPELHHLSHGFPNWTLEDVLDNHNGKIKSVRRISDGEVFSISEITQNDTGYVYKPIKRFFIKDNVMYAQFDEGWGRNDGCLGLNALMKKVKQPLFQSFDGKMMYENDKCWILSTGNWCISETVACGNPFTGENGHFKYFSTEAAAKEFVTMNKPMFSIKEIKESCHDDSAGGGILYLHIDKLLEAAKEKINQ